MKPPFDTPAGEAKTGGAVLLFVDLIIQHLNVMLLQQDVEGISSISHFHVVMNSAL
jgi:hypothetical protein